MDPIKTDEQVLSRSYGVSVLEYETTMPTKFMCGTDMGMVFVCNRKGKSPLEKINTRVSNYSSSIFGSTQNGEQKTKSIIPIWHTDDDSFGAGLYDNPKSKFLEKFSHRRRLDGTYLVRRLS